MTINLKDVFGDELLDGDLIRSSLERMPPIDGSEATIDYTGCIMEYDATGIITDHVINEFIASGKPPDITIIYDLDYPEDYLLDFLFSETKFLGSSTASITNEERRNILCAKLHERNGIIRIRITDLDGTNIINEYVYGKH